MGFLRHDPHEGGSRKRPKALGGVTRAPLLRVGPAIPWQVAPQHGHPAGDTRPAVIQTSHTPEAEAASVRHTHRTSPRRQTKPAPWSRSRAEAFGSCSGEEASGRWSEAAYAGSRLQAGGTESEPAIPLRRPSLATPVLEASGEEVEAKRVTGYLRGVGAWTPAAPATTLPRILQTLPLQHLLPDSASLLHSR